MYKGGLVSRRTGKILKMPQEEISGGSEWVGWLEVWANFAATTANAENPKLSNCKQILFRNLPVHDSFIIWISQQKYLILCLFFLEIIKFISNGRALLRAGVQKIFPESMRKEKFIWDLRVFGVEIKLETLSCWILKHPQVSLLCHWLII